MKVILIKDVARLGRKSEIKEVPDGHALNFLIPRKLAIIATPDGLKRINEETRQHNVHKEADMQVFRNACNVLNERVIPYPVEANDKGSLFKGVNENDIIKHLEGEGISIPKDSFTLAHPLKTVGVHEIPLAYGGAEGVCRLEIVKK